MVASNAINGRQACFRTASVDSREPLAPLLRFGFDLSICFMSRGLLFLSDQFPESPSLRMSLQPGWITSGWRITLDCASEFRSKEERPAIACGGAWIFLLVILGAPFSLAGEEGRQAHGITVPERVSRLQKPHECVVSIRLIMHSVGFKERNSAGGTYGCQDTRISRTVPHAKPIRGRHKLRWAVKATLSTVRG
jgi:hypothetical protein